VVKIKEKIIIFGIMLVLLIQGVSAVNQSMLEISDLDVKVGSKSDKNLNDGDSISQEAAPEDNIEFNIELRNLYDDFNGDLEIEDITVTVIIDSIDDGDELEEEDEISKIRPGRDKSISFDFEVPLKVDEDSYDVTIDVEAEDENGTSHDFSWALSLEVEKEKHDVKIYRKSLLKDMLKCDRSTQITAGVINIGQEDEDDVTLEVTNSELGISKRETFDLTEDYDDDDNSFTKTYYLDIDEDKKAGTYPIAIKVTFDDGDEIKQEIVNLVLEDCESVVKEQEEEEEKVTVTTTPATTQPTTISQPQEVYAPVEEENFYTKYKYAMFVGLAYIAVIAVIIMVAVKLFRKK